MTIARAFNDEMTSRLTGLSVGQLRAWDREKLYSPSLAEDNRRLAYSRVYSFRDIVSLRVIASLKNDHDVSTQHLKKVATKLGHLGKDVWAETKLYVLNKRVVFEEPRGRGRQEVVSGQGVFEIPLRVATADAEKDVANVFGRDTSKVGQIDASRFVMNGDPVVAGTRIPVSTIKSYLDLGLPDERILADYPQLKSDDIRAARDYIDKSAA